MIILENWGRDRRSNKKKTHNQSYAEGYASGERGYFSREGSRHQDQPLWETPGSKYSSRKGRRKESYERTPERPNRAMAILQENLKKIQLHMG